MQACSRIDADNPQAAQITPPIAAVTIRISARLQKRFVSAAEQLAPGAIIALGPANEPLMSLPSNNSTFNSHASPLLFFMQVRGQPLDTPDSPRMGHNEHLVELAQGALGFLAAQVALALLGAHQLALTALSKAEALGG